ncbi:MAG: hypothetical protein KKF56_02805 [Nanoarchaeota archaeon]|nr:hypothetical protein [Nanoarchaeota archaeon]
MLTLTSLITSLIKGSTLFLSKVSYVLDDFIEDKDGTLSNQDHKELNRLRLNPQELTTSYIFNRIEPYILPFYKKED